MTFNPKQFRILIAAGMIFVGMGLIPPWTYTLDAQSIHREKPAGYTLIIAPPNPEKDAPAYGVRLDIPRLLIQWIVLVAATGCLILLTKEPDSK
ncbi:hypothetical protein [Shewanella glacialipiscicola]|uniref:hypothetical protein n=1 Tax=Shewanella glacialipiscicola TaxID=614069 RepID=UPI003D7AB52E